MEEKTYVDDIDRSIYDIKNDEKDVYRIQEGLAPEIVTEISRKKRILPGWKFSGCSPCRYITA